MITKFTFYSVDRRNALENWVAEYAFQQTEPTPWAPLKRRLDECNVAVLTTAGLRLKTQHQYAIDRRAGSAEYREISMYVRPADLAHDFTNYDPSESQKDLNVLVPVERMKELVEQRKIRGVTETFYSFFGLCENKEELKRNAAIVARRILDQGADVAFLFTANLICNQTGGIIARELERRGISTVLLATVREMVGEIRVPRTVFVNFPFGRPLGRAGDLETQRAILGDMITALKKFQRPGRILDVRRVWDGDLD